MINELYNFIPLAQVDNKTFTAEVLGIQMKTLQPASDFAPPVMLQYESLPENITEGSLVEITLSKITETGNGLYAQSVIVK